MATPLSSEDYKCPQCGATMNLVDTKRLGSGWLYTLVCPIHKVDVPIFKED